MATFTPNLNLYKPDSTDNFEDFRAEFNNNMDILDNGGGGGGGHTIVDPNDSDMPEESKLQFTGNVNVTDDPVNGKTIVDIPASAGSGHTIINPSGTSMTQRNGLKFTGNVTVTDDSGNNETIVTITGGGGGGHNYSTTEQVIGTWVNGKPLYQISYPMTINISGGQTVTIATLVDCEDIVYFDGWIKESGIFYGLNDRTTRLTVNTSGQLQFNSASSWNGSGYVTIRYTKTTD